MPDARPAAVVVLAAGEGKRMRSALPKVLHEIAGRSLVGHVLAATAPLAAEHTVVVIGHGRDQVGPAVEQLAADAKTVTQAEQNGTGHAMRLAMEAVPEASGPVVVVPGDTPLLTPGTLQRLVAEHVATGAAATLLTAVVADPTGYGRVLRDPAGRVRRIVEHRDATPDERAVAEIGTSVYVFDAELLRGALGRLRTDNAQGEEYLTDVIGILVGDGRAVGALVTDDAAATAGVNDRVQLAAAGRVLNDRLLDAAMRAGATVVDPQSTWIDVAAEIEPDAVVLPGTQLLGRTRVAAGAQVGPDCTLTDTTVGPAARVVRSHCESAEIGPEASVGPYAYLRPGTKLGRKAKAGTHVEMKNADLGESVKVPHLTYVGDATIGEGSNIGAATIFVNYDGVAKHRTAVGSYVRVGSDTMLVAPITIGDGAYTAAGSVITEDVPPGAMAVARGRQRNIDGWVERKRAGTPSAEAAQRARGADPTDDDGERQAESGEQ